jgi:hypothetical protein
VLEPAHHEAGRDPELSGKVLDLPSGRGQRVKMAPAMSAEDGTSALPRKGLWGTLLVLGCFWLALVAGTAIGAFFVPPGSGLAGPAIALVYGLLGAGVGVGLGLAVAWRCSPRLVRAVAAAVLLLGLAAAGWIGWRMVALPAAQGRAAARLG